MVSEKFKEAVKRYPQQQYQLAWEARVHPVVLSQMITGYIRPQLGDERVIRVGKLLGLRPNECFLGDHNE
jgi:hypothetical protein